MLTLKEVISEIENADKLFYVYFLCKPDGIPFYVGKGTKQSKGQCRVTWHEYEAKLDSPSPSNPFVNALKVNTIKKIWREGGQVGYGIDSWHDSEAAAYERERELIAKIGRRITKEGTLTNILPGGEKENGLIPDDVKLRISESLKKYYADNPEKLNDMSERAKQYFSDPEAREYARLNSIKNRTADYIINWLATADPEVLEEKYRKHSEWLTGWHQTDEGKEKTKQAAAKRNEKFRTDEHRKHMAERTRKYNAENPEAHAERRAKARAWARERCELKQKCLRLVRDRLVNAGWVKPSDKDVTGEQLYSWKQKGMLDGIGVVVPDGRSASIEDWQKFQLTLVEVVV